MQIKKCSLLVICGLFLSQNLVAMDAPTMDDGKPVHPRTQDQFYDISEQGSSSKEKENVFPIGHPGYPRLEIPYDDIDPKLLMQAFAHAPEKLKAVVSASKVNWHGADPRYTTKILLLVGSPGVGKTLLSKAIALQLNKPYLYFNTTEFSSSYQHSKIQSLREKVQPFVDQDINVVLILDEITHLTEFHDKKEARDLDPGAATALWLLLDRLSEKKNVWLIGTTNYSDKVPEQIKQRIGDAGIFKINSPVNKKEIILYHVQKAFGIKNVPEEALRKLERQLKKKTPREIEIFTCCLLRKAAINHPEEQTVTLTDVEQAIQENRKGWSVVIWDLAKKGKPYYLSAIRETITIGLTVWGNSQNLAFSLLNLEQATRGLEMQQEALEIQRREAGWEGAAKQVGIAVASQVASQAAIYVLTKYAGPFIILKLVGA